MSDTKIRAALNARDLPMELFGPGAAAKTRKLVYQTIALWANPDGTNAFPSEKTLAAQCGLTERGLRKTTTWLKAHHLLKVDKYASDRHTNVYTVLVSDEAQAACKAQLRNDAEHSKLQMKKEATREKRMIAAKRRWNPEQFASTNPERSVPSDPEHSVPSEPGTFCIPTRNVLHVNPEHFACNPERFACPENDKSSGGNGLQPKNASTVLIPSIDRPIPSIQPSDAHGACAAMEEKLDGWLAARIASVIREREGLTCLPNQKEKPRLTALAKEQGHLRVLVAFYWFADRSQGLAGLSYPISVFLSEAPQWIAFAADQHGCPPTLEAEVKRIAAGLPELPLLCDLAFADVETGVGDGLHVVVEYVGSEYVELQVQRRAQRMIAAHAHDDASSSPQRNGYSCFAEFEEGRVWFHNQEARSLMEDGYLEPPTSMSILEFGTFGKGRCEPADGIDFDDLANRFAEADTQYDEILLGNVQHIQDDEPARLICLPHRDRLDYNPSMSLPDPPLAEVA